MTHGRSAHVRTVYERVAERYDRYYRSAWLAVAGRAAERAMLARVVAFASASDSPRVLDAGAGTGALSRQLAVQLSGVHPVLLDLSPAMLGEAKDLGAPRVVATLDLLPFDDDTFDVVMCGWVIETVDRPAAAVAEMLRVLRPSGLLSYSFCSRPGLRRDRWRTGPLRGLVHIAFAGHFLSDAQTPFHQCETSTRRRFHAGLVTVISLAKCCTVTAGTVPAVRRTHPAAGAIRPASHANTMEDLR